MLKDARLREQGTSMNVMKERRGEGEEKKEGRRANASCRAQHTQSDQSTDQEARKGAGEVLS